MVPSWPPIPPPKESMGAPPLPLSRGVGAGVGVMVQKGCMGRLLQYLQWVTGKIHVRKLYEWDLQVT
ncbi:hypothetical protein E2C01_021194 [Portunus trituberculatus]|uniref:Uncharacterized protein n=1 Tax=Portunus trituberculatus TaxID=210409 RepID=A0A5B7E1U7_PORTR|nr:hypothetical protein [Portunus trituberculatus]